MEQAKVTWEQDGLLLMIKQGEAEILLLPGDARDLTAELLTRLNEQPEAYRAEIESPDSSASYYEDPWDLAIVQA